MLFDAKNFNGEVFGAYVDKVPNLNRNQLLKSGAIVEKTEYAAMIWVTRSKLKNICLMH